ncbi:hypothetical protein R3P38DRAFT_2784737 [Favolaschia claudopus]|uniref:Uncharacterized protein n=1 Tax=Favolaschia claudopus TaxID=2862362 RepID=A0AAW0AYX6_9AGAR
MRTTVDGTPSSPKLVHLRSVEAGSGDDGVDEDEAACLPAPAPVATRATGSVPSRRHSPGNTIGYLVANTRRDENDGLDGKDAEGGCMDLGAAKTQADEGGVPQSSDQRRGGRGGRQRRQGEDGDDAVEGETKTTVAIVVSPYRGLDYTIRLIVPPSSACGEGRGGGKGPDGSYTPPPSPYIYLVHLLILAFTQSAMVSRTPSASHRHIRRLGRIRIGGATVSTDRLCSRAGYDGGEGMYTGLVMGCGLRAGKGWVGVDGGRKRMSGEGKMKMGIRGGVKEKAEGYEERGTRMLSCERTVDNGEATERRDPSSRPGIRSNPGLCISQSVRGAEHTTLREGDA